MEGTDCASAHQDWSGNSSRKAAQGEQGLGYLNNLV